MPAPPRRGRHRRRLSSPQRTVRAARHGAAYLEGIFTPEPAVATAIGLTRIFEGFCDGAAEAEQTHGVIVRLTPEQCRGCDLAFGAAVARAAVRYRDRGIGFGLAGREGRYPDAALAH